MDWGVFWTAFGAIGTTLGSLITAVAVVVAVKQYTEPLTKRIMIKFTSAIPVGLPIDAPLLCISVANSGIRPICISDIRFNVGKKDLFLGAVQFTIPGALSQLSFPAEVQPEGKIDMYLNQKQVSQFLAESIADGCLNKRTPVKIAVMDQTGGRYLHRTGCKVGDLILL